MSELHNFCDTAKAVLEAEAKAITDQINHIDHNFQQACEMLLHCQGRIILSGMGKSGHIATKIAATFASTGTPAFFIHAAEANHGDLGMITAHDTVIAISFSGETIELVNLIPEVKRIGAKLIAITGNDHSTLATEADIKLTVEIDQEACPLGLAPTSSTTATLALGDALAVALLDVKGFTKEDFAKSHPGGKLGQSLTHIKEIMRTGDQLPIVDQNSSISEALVTISQKALGAALITDNKKLLGVFTDGDLRRCLDKDINLRSTTIKDIATLGCKTVRENALIEEALHIMELKKITVLPVTNKNDELVGAIHMHDILNKRIA